jgi:O-antigen ligase
LWGVRLGVRGSLSIFLLVGFGLGAIGIVSADWQPKFFALTLPVSLSLPEAPPHGVSLNQLAGTVLYFWPLLLINWQRRWLTLPLLFWSSVLVATQSRTAWFAVSITLLIWLIAISFWGNLRTKRLARALLAASLIGGGLLLSQLNFRAIHTAWLSAPIDVTPGSLQSLGMRREIWHWGILALSKHPFRGIGFGTFRAVVNTFPATLPPNFDIAHVHNLFLQIGLDLGLIGLAAYCYLIFRVANMAYRLLTLNANAVAQTLGLGYLMTLAAIHLFGLLDTVALGAKTAILFWLLLALIELTYDQFCAPTDGAKAPSALSRQGRSESEPVSSPR